jgi:heme-degrading monooxygenase HmoA
VALSRFTVANGMAGAVKTAFLDRPHLVDGVPGFIRLEVLSPRDDPREIWLVTFWRDEASFDAWHGSHLRHEAHRGIPRGLKLVPRSFELRRFDLVAT